MSDNTSRFYIKSPKVEGGYICLPSFFDLNAEAAILNQHGADCANNISYHPEINSTSVYEVAKIAYETDRIDDKSLLIPAYYDNDEGRQKYVGVPCKQVRHQPWDDMIKNYDRKKMLMNCPFNIEAD